jgi:hypothetical protein
MMNKMTVTLCSLLSVLRERWWSLVAAAGFCYLLAVRLVRHRRLRRIHSRFSGRNWKLDMSVPEAQDVMHGSIVWDMPSLLFYAVTFAGLRTLGIPSISRTFLQSKELVFGPQIAKRIIDVRPPRFPRLRAYTNGAQTALAAGAPVSFFMPLHHT